jgi:hypothetical protein
MPSISRQLQNVPIVLSKYKVSSSYVQVFVDTKALSVSTSFLVFKGFLNLTETY